MHAASRHGTPSLTSLPKDDEVSSEIRPPRPSIQSFKSIVECKIIVNILSE